MKFGIGLLRGIPFRRAGVHRGQGDAADCRPRVAGMLFAIQLTILPIRATLAVDGGCAKLLLTQGRMP
jgi:hypothetical protein